MINNLKTDGCKVWMVSTTRIGTSYDLPLVYSSGKKDIVNERGALHMDDMCALFRQSHMPYSGNVACPVPALVE